ncbi:gfo/Idh/MocA family oxidoreductase [Aerococcus agrisoli]|uniref:Gfo/Idh/MocA family oxidoreductase n=1 Tax=Aerococcus agrisoli TaxID=2487350 RepID=A0A3N4GWC4_9LACT|nr:Gfo/Idh/MocA family oxidoreductase [Aerococcus agrisoli]RPA57274.1 gfo/Idh/MocA family oxidoreductase [Aerococcus agrisoli]
MATENKVRFGIIGFGNQGSMYAKFITDGMVPSMDLVAIADIDPAKLTQIEETYPQVQRFDDYKAIIDSGEVDAIITTVPHYLHPEIATYALSKGIHVLNEKPAGVYTKHVKALNEYAKTVDATYAIMFNQRNNPLYQKLKTILDNKEIGDIRRVNWIITTWWRPQAYYDQSAWRATWGGEGGGVLVNQAPHQLDLIQWLTGVPEKVVSRVQYGYQRDIAVEDQVHAIFEYENGATGVFVTSTNEIVGSDRLEIVGDAGKIIVDDSAVATIYRMKESETDINKNMDVDGVRKLMTGQLAFEELYDKEVIQEENVWGLQHSGVLENFAQHILNGTPLIADGQEGINGVRLANAIHLSSWTGEKVSIPEFDDDQYLDLLNQHITDEGKFDTRK